MPRPPRPPRQFSLVAKILTLAPGEFFILPDLDRQLVTLRSRSPKLHWLEFKANRVKYIEGDRILPGLKIQISDGG